MDSLKTSKRDQLVLEEEIKKNKSRPKDNVPESLSEINYYNTPKPAKPSDLSHSDTIINFADRSTGKVFDLDDKDRKRPKPYKIGIDLGTANLLVYVDGVGIVFNEPSVIALEYGTGRVIALGHEAAIMEGRTHTRIKIVKPLSGGVISDLTAAIKLLSNAISRLETINIDLSRSTLLICCPSEVTEIEQEAMIDLAREVGVLDTFVEEEVKAGAIGADLPVFKPLGSFVIDIGGGSTDIGILSMGDIVVSDSIRVAGNFFDKELQSYIQFTHKLLIGKPTAERMKIKLGCLLNYASEERKMSIAGRDLITGLPKKITVSQVEVARVLTPQFIEIAKIALSVLQRTPAQLSADIVKYGLVLNGGGALIKGAAEFFADHLRVKVRVSKNPLTAIVEGSRALLKNRGNYLITPDF